MGGKEEKEEKGGELPVRRLPMARILLRWALNIFDILSCESKHLACLCFFFLFLPGVFHFHFESWILSKTWQKNRGLQ